MHESRLMALRSRASALADTGAYGGWWEIAERLEADGFPLARWLIDLDADLQARLQERCRARPCSLGKKADRAGE